MRSVSEPESRPSGGGGSGYGRSAGIAGVRIRAAQEDDIDRIVEIEKASFAAPWSSASFRSIISRPQVLVLVAEMDPGLPSSAGQASGLEVVGHAVLWHAADEAELANLAVDPGFRGRGIAGVLLDELIGRAWEAGIRSIFLEVRFSNEAALSLYTGRGFREVALRKHYYDRPKEDARVLHLRLHPDTRLADEHRRADTE